MQANLVQQRHMSRDRCTLFIARVCRPWLLRICFRLSILSNKTVQATLTPNFVERSFIALSQLLPLLPHVRGHVTQHPHPILHRELRAPHHTYQLESTVFPVQCRHYFSRLFTSSSLTQFGFTQVKPALVAMLRCPKSPLACINSSPDKTRLLRSVARASHGTAYTPTFLHSHSTLISLNRIAFRPFQPRPNARAAISSIHPLRQPFCGLTQRRSIMRWTGVL